MRIPAIAAAALLATGSVALAAPATVTVSIGPEFQKKLDKTYGQREGRFLTDDLKEEVETALARSGRFPDARVELTLTDAKPNRPTFQQLRDTPGLSMESFGVGGAAIEGRIVAADGTATPLTYKWYETDIRQAYGDWIWSDATWTFNRLARQLARGDVPKR